LNAQNVCPSEIYHQLIAVYGEGVMNESNVRKWCQMFNEERSGCPSLMTKDLENRIDQHIRTNTRIILDEIHKKFPQISHSLIHEIVTEHFYYKKICARWVSRSLKSTRASIWVLL
jgi:hypothetical protein